MLSSARGRELLKLLTARNGFYAFEPALLVRPLECQTAPFGLVQWNNAATWITNYKANLTGIIFFAEEIFGNQFCIKEEKINLFNSETSELKVVANTLEDWTQWIIEDSKSTTGWPFGHFWQLRNGPLHPGNRLLPKVPFVLGGQFAPDNLYTLGEVEGMRYRATIANQILECPDGSNSNLLAR